MMRTATIKYSVIKMLSKRPTALSKSRIECSMESCSRWNSRHAISISSLEASPLESLSNMANAASASSGVGKNRAISSTMR